MAADNSCGMMHADDLAQAVHGVGCSIALSYYPGTFASL